MPRSPLIALLATAGALAVPATAAAEVIEVGQTPPGRAAELPAQPCLAVEPHDRLPGQGRHQPRR